jgi:hypothetical protein
MTGDNLNLFVIMINLKYAPTLSRVDVIAAILIILNQRRVERLARFSRRVERLPPTKKNIYTIKPPNYSHKRE